VYLWCDNPAIKQRTGTKVFPLWLLVIHQAAPPGQDSSLLSLLGPPPSCTTPLVWLYLVYGRCYKDSMLPLLPPPLLLHTFTHSHTWSPIHTHVHTPTAVSSMRANSRWSGAGRVVRCLAQGSNRQPPRLPPELCVRVRSPFT